MREKEQKYVMAGTDDEVALGDVISVELVKDFKDGRTLKKEVEFKLTEDTLPFALEMNIIEEVEDEEEEQELLDFDDEDDCEDCIMDELLNDLCADHEALEKRVEALEEQVKSLLAQAKPANTSKTVSPKKK